jgi:acyl-CoA-binding protein
MEDSQSLRESFGSNEKSGLFIDFRQGTSNDAQNDKNGFHRASPVDLYDFFESLARSCSTADAKRLATLCGRRCCMSSSGLDTLLESRFTHVMLSRDCSRTCGSREL